MTDARPTTSGRPNAQVPVPLLRPRAGEHGREDREERRPLRLELAQSQRDEHRHEEDAAPDPEHAGEDPGDHAQKDRENDRRGAHEASSQTPSAARSTAKP